LLRIDEFAELQSIFIGMNHQIDAAEWLPFYQKNFCGACRAFPSPCVDPTDLAATEKSSFIDPFAKN
jgi:hypothetical protein